MTHTPNTLADMFPTQIAQIRALKETDAEFARLHDDYHEVTREIRRAESDIEPMSDEHMETLRQKRLLMLDKISETLEHSKD